LRRAAAADGHSYGHGYSHADGHAHGADAHPDGHADGADAHSNKSEAHAASWAVGHATY
jgi:hypothetical protein